MAAPSVRLRERVGRWLLGGERVGVPPLDFEPQYSRNFGPGLGRQPAHDVLLREMVGVPAMAQRAIAARVSSLEPQVFTTRRVEAGTTQDEILDDHPLKRLLDRPHPNYSRRQIMRVTAQHLTSVGEAYWLKVGNGLGVPAELHPMPPSKVTPLVSNNVVEGYLVIDGAGKEMEIEAAAVIRFFFPDPEAMWRSIGYLGPAGTVADAHKFASEHLRRHYQMDATPKIALEANVDAQPFMPEERERFQAIWKQLYSSRAGSATGAPAPLPMGYKLIEMAMQSGADVTPLLEYWRDDLLMTFGVPRSILGQVVSGDRSSAETNQFVFDLHTITPIADMIEDALTLQLAGDFDDSIFVKFDEFVSQDKSHALAQEQSDLDRKVRSINMVLEDRGHDPVEWGEQPVGKFGDVPYTGEDSGFGGMPNPFAPAAEDDEGEPEEEMPEEDEEPRRRDSTSTRAAFYWKRQEHSEKQFIPAFYQELVSLLTLQKNSVIEKLEKRTPRARIESDDLFAPDAWRNLFEVRLQPVRERAFSTVITDVLADFGITSFDFKTEQKQALRRDGAKLITWANETTQKRIAKTLAESVEAGEGVEQVAKRLRDVFKVRRREAITTARTEILKASSRATLEGFKTAGVRKMRWHTSMDDAVRDTHQEMEGVEAEVGQPFEVPTATGGKELADAPRQGFQGRSMTAANAINCRCFLVPVNEPVTQEELDKAASIFGTA